MTDWKHCVTLTIPASKVAAALANFPIYVNLSASSGINAADLTAIFDELGAEKLKIRVTASDGVTECYVEVVSWDHITEVAELWVKAPNLSATIDTVLYFYYDKDHADNTTNVGVTGSAPAEAVWDSNFKLVCHMNDNPDTSHVMDSTSNDNDGTKKAANEPIEATGKIGKEQTSDGTADYIQITTNDGLNPTDAISIMTWVKPTQRIANENLVNKRHLGTWYKGYQFMLHYAAPRIIFNDDAGGLDLTGAELPYDGATRSHVAATYNGAVLKIYVDGAESASKTVSGAIVASPSNLFLVSQGGTEGFYAGGIDEIQIVAGGLSPAWVGASYETQNDSFISYGPFQHEVSIVGDYVPKEMRRKHLKLRQPMVICKPKWGHE